MERTAEDVATVDPFRTSEMRHRFRNGSEGRFVFVADPPQEEPEPLMGDPFADPFSNIFYET
jgi:hypothetical protein